MSSYFTDIKEGISTTLQGLKLTLQHLRDATSRRKPMGVAEDNYFEQQSGLVTLQYPHEKLPIPDNGRYRLHNEIDDCIVCDKCAKVCPVDCITIEAIKATEEIGRASDGSPIRLYASKFDIDMAKCCYCGLCTVVCPTECLTMEKTFDYSVFELGNLTYNFSNLSPEEAEEKKRLIEQFQREKEELKAQQAAAKVKAEPPAESAAPKRPVFRPTQKPAASTTETVPVTEPTPAAGPTENKAEIPAPKRPAFRPTQKPLTKPAATDEIPAGNANAETPAEPAAVTEDVNKPAPTRPAFRPSMKPKTDAAETGEPTTPPESAAPTAPEPPKKPAFRPTMKPKAEEPQPEATSAPLEARAPDPAASVAPEPPKKPAFRPTMKPKSSGTAEAPVPPTESAPDQSPAAEPTDVAPKPRPAFRPTMKPKPTASQSPESEPGAGE
ncbi:hypothetical protein GCM10023189_44170 [Nibrella saemangeumensis]|uniref:4Fe-4S ferredoxin-type domain-containing protein n=1 Tax=Nibrella saemangeumensis TaxID=1084526 RepID=A0ABP8NBM1_9BACT